MTVDSWLHVVAQKHQWRARDIRTSKGSAKKDSKHTTQPIGPPIIYYQHPMLKYRPLPSDKKTKKLKRCSKVPVKKFME